jgi:hypothetical protein
VRFDDTGKLAQRRYEELVARCIAKHGADKPSDAVETPLSAWEVQHGADN